MVSPWALLTSVRDAYRQCSDLVTALNGDADAIRAYSGDEGGEASVLKAIYTAPHPSITFVYGGFTAGTMRDGGPVKHQIEASVKLADLQTRPDSSRMSVLHALVGGTSSTGELMMWHEFTDECSSMENFSCRRQALMVDQLGNTVDYYQFSFTLIEKG